MTTHHMHIACWITKAMYSHTHTHTHTECVILIGFLLQRWLHECASMLCYTYIVSLVSPEFHVLCGYDFDYVCFWNQYMAIFTSLNLLQYRVSVTVNVVCCEWKHCSSLCCKKRTQICF